jgi:predicted RNA binding protein YcfA (HicA-like mRNA interferase family)
VRAIGCRKADVHAWLNETSFRQRIHTLFQRRGWVLKRVNGSHHVFAKTGHRERIVVPVHGNHPLKIAGITEADL